MNWHDKVIYQIYPKSFYDSNGDGIGDIQGIIQKIDYIKQLNIDMIWFNPFFVSPQYDNGYDVADYRKIDPRFGTMADLEELIAALKKHDIDIMLDMVLNHTSTQHEWFLQALAGNKKYQDFYYLREAKNGQQFPNNWQSKFGGPAWAKFGKTHLYYLHLFDTHQADLNWHNPAVRQEMISIVNFWLQKGIRGFRFDVLNVIGKDSTLPSSPAGQDSKFMYTDTPIVNEFIKDLAENSFGKVDDVISVGEMSSTTISKSIEYTNPKHHELSMVFQFHHLKTDYKDGQKWTKDKYDFDKLRQLLHNWSNGMDPDGWLALFWNNHDQPWAINRFGDPAKNRVKSAQLLASSMHLNRGTPFIYMGEELGMIDPNYSSMEDYVDVEAHNAYQDLIQDGKSAQEAFEIVKTKARDNSRTPMSWNDSENAGFSTAKPWLQPVNQARINVEKELSTGQIFPFYQKLIALRKQYRVIQDGDYKPFGENINWLYAYERHYQTEHMLVLNNFANHEIEINLPEKWQQATILLTNQPDITVQSTVILKEFTTLALLIKE